MSYCIDCRHAPRLSSSTMCLDCTKRHYRSSAGKFDHGYLTDRAEDLGLPLSDLLSLEPIPQTAIRKALSELDRILAI